MTSRAPERTPRRTPDYRVRVAWLLAVVAAVAVTVGLQAPTSPMSQAASSVSVPLQERPSAHGTAPGEAVAEHHASSREHRAAPGEGRRALGLADGAVPAGTSVFSDDVPGVANLDAALLGALRQAASDAAEDGVRFDVTSGWRSPEYQQHLLDDAVAKYGSATEAARWVATPDRSEHVSGNAVDIAPADARKWLLVHGAAYGLCRTYGNEPWHYERHPVARERGCPPIYADPTHDPRMTS